MKKLIGIFSALTLAFTLTGLTSLAAATSQQGSGQSWSQQKSEQGEHTLSGQLQSVDSNARTFVVKNDEGKEITFRYNDETKVVGSDQSVAGLASQSGTSVKVTFEATGKMGQEPGMHRQGQESEANRLATKIEIQKQKEEKY